MFTVVRRKVDLTREHWNSVFQPSLRVQGADDTPNPGVWCHRSASCITDMVPRTLFPPTPHRVVLVTTRGRGGDYLRISRPQFLRSSDRRRIRITTCRRFRLEIDLGRFTTTGKGLECLMQLGIVWILCAAERGGTCSTGPRNSDSWLTDPQDIRLSHGNIPL